MATAKGREANYIEGDKDMQLVLTAVGGPLGIGYGSTMPIHETSDNNVNHNHCVECDITQIHY